MIRRLAYSKYFLTFIIIVSLLFVNYTIFFIDADASSPWIQSDWSGGEGQQAWSNTDQYLSGSNVDDSVADQVSIIAKNSWYDPDWSARKTILVDNPAGSTLTNFQVYVFVDTQALILGSKLKADCSDLRFTTDDNIDIPYWIATAPTANTCNRASTKVWLNLPTISSSGETLYMYYSNPAASAVSNGDNVFLKFGDFTTGSSLPSGWVKTDVGGKSGTATVGGGALTLTNTNGLDVWQNTYEATHAYPNSTVNGAFVAETVVNTFSGSPDPWAKAGITVQNSVAAVTSNGQALVSITNGNGINFQWLTSGTYLAADTGVATGTYTLPLYLKLIKNTSNQYTAYYSSNGTNWTIRGSAQTAFGSSANQYVTLFVTPHNGSSTATATFPVFYVRKYTATEPVVYPPVNEESSYENSNTILSSIFDTEHIDGANWGTVEYTATIPANSNLKVKVRTGNMSDLSDATDFASCDPVVSGYDISSNSCVNDLDRYVQYQVTMSITSASGTTPILEDIAIAFSEGDLDLPTASFWTQSDWVGGDGQTNWLDTTSYLSSSSIIDSSAGEVTLENKDLGDGADGAITITSGQTIPIDTTAIAAGRSSADAVNFNISSFLPSGSNVVSLSTTHTGLDIGDEVLIINLKGISTSYDGVGKYETKRITAINGTALTLDGNLKNSYDGNTQRVMLQRVPNYTDVTVQSTATFTVSAYDNTTGKGGVLFFRANGTVLLANNSTISANGKGYLGGVTGSGGTGGNTYNGVGGSGAAVGTTSLQGGAGGSRPSPTPTVGTIGGGGGGGDGGDGGGGGGGAGYGTVGTGGIGFLFLNSGCNGDGHENGQPGSGTVGGNGGYNCGVSTGGGGGGTYGSPELSQLFLGSAGGAGGSYNGAGGAGGRGGGIIFIAANILDNSAGGFIYNNGNAGGAPAGSSQGGGGGGAGGSIAIKANNVTLGTGLITATGGAAGSNKAGTGGSGRIALLAYNSVSGSSTPNYNTGIDEYKTSGSLTSSIFDTTFNIGAHWGILQYTVTGNSNTPVSVKVRTSNDAAMTGATDFSACDAIASGAPLITSDCVNEGDRYIQYHVDFVTYDSFTTPSLESISIEYYSTDLDVPLLTMDAFAPNPTDDLTPSFTGSVSDDLSIISSVEFQVDSTLGAWTSCVSDDGTFNSLGEDFTCNVSTPLDDGSHVIYFRTSDSSGNMTDIGSYPFIEFDIISDSAAPALSVNPLPFNPIYTATPSFYGQATEAVGTVFNVEFQIDSLVGTWTSCASSDGSFDESQESFVCIVDTILSNGQHTAYFRATDSNNVTTDNSSVFSIAFNVQVNPTSNSSSSGGQTSVIENPDDSIPEIKIAKDINNPNLYLITVSDNFPLVISNVVIVTDNITVISKTCTKPSNYTIYCILEVSGKGDFRVIATDSSNLTREVRYEIAQDGTGTIIDEQTEKPPVIEVPTNNETSNPPVTNTGSNNDNNTSNNNNSGYNYINETNPNDTEDNNGDIVIDEDYVYINPNQPVVNEVPKVDKTFADKIVQSAPLIMPVTLVTLPFLPVILVFFLFWLI